MGGRGGQCTGGQVLCSTTTAGVPSALLDTASGVGLALSPEFPAKVQVEAGRPPSLRDALHGRPGSVFVRGHHKIARDEILAIPGYCHPRSPVAPDEGPQRGEIFSSHEGFCASRQRPVPFELTGEDFCANISGAVILQSAYGLITEIVFERNMEDPKIAREQNLACVTVVAGKWRLIQCQVRSAGGVAVLSKDTAQTSLELSEAGGTGGSTG